MVSTIPRCRSAVFVALALTLIVALGRAPAADATIAPRVVGGGAATPAELPWQVAIVVHSQANAGTGRFCGGVIRDALHVITAAHCLDYMPEDGDVDDPSGRDVVAGAGDLSVAGPPAQRIQIASWTQMPGYDAQSFVSDAAVATLSTPLDVSAAGVRPAVIIASGDVTPTGVSTRVSGFGTTPSPTTTLHAADLLTVSDPDCDAFFQNGIDAPTMICAIAPSRDACLGDSGGPLTLDDGTLIGLVSFGPDPCADPGGAPGVYTELAQSAIASYIRDPTADPADDYHPPASTSPPALTGLAKAGEPLTCAPGTWDGAATPELDYRFRESTGATLRDWAASPVYVPGTIEAGRRIVCVVRARDARGASVAPSGASEPVATAAAAAPATPPSTPPAVRVTAKAADTTAPHASFRWVRCRRTTCTVSIGATDGRVGSGVRGVRVTMLPARGGARSRAARRVAPGIYHATFSRIPRGRAWFLAAVEDAAGNHQARVAIRRATVR